VLCFFLLTALIGRRDARLSSRVATHTRTTRSRVHVAALAMDFTDLQNDTPQESPALEAPSGEEERRRRRRRKTGYSGSGYTPTGRIIEKPCSHSVITHHTRAAQPDRLARLEAVVEEQAALIEKLARNGSLMTKLSTSTGVSSTTTKAQETKHEVDSMEKGNETAEAMEEDTQTEQDAAANGSKLDWMRAPPADGVVGAIPIAAVEQLRIAVESPNNWPTARGTLWLASLLALFIIQVGLLVIVSEAGTSRSCTPATQKGCHRGMLCSQSVANGQCVDCQGVLAEPFRSILARLCPTASPFSRWGGTDYAPYPFRYAPSDPGVYNNRSFPGACAMYGSCLGHSPDGEPDDGDRYADIDLDRCDYLVVATTNIKFHQIAITFVGGNC
jgi:hypothetical protein